MARHGAAPGERRGGRVAKTPNRKTLEKQLIAAREAEAAMDGTTKFRRRRLGREVLDDFMHLFVEMAEFYRPRVAGEAPTPKRRRNRELFERYAKLAVDAADRLAPYQSPTFKSVTVIAPPEVPAERAKDGEVSKLSPQETYRIMKDAVVIEMAVEEEPPKRKRAGRDG